MKLVCIQCNKEYEAKRSDSKTCSPSCRKSLSRLSVTKSIKDVTDNVTDKQLEIEILKKEVIIPKSNWDI